MKRKTKKTLVSLLCLFILAAGIFGLWRLSTPRVITFVPSAQTTTAPALSAEALSVSFLDVGEGDSALVISGGEAMLIDGGPAEAGKAVTEQLRARGVTSLKYLVCTHAHADHCGGLAEVVEAFPTETLFAPCRTQADSAAFTALADAAAERSLDFTLPSAGDVWTLGQAELTFIGPVRDYGDKNGNSLVISLRCGENVFLFAADATAESLKDSADGGYDLRCDVLKLPHHGSSDGFDRETLALTAPRFAVISCGAGNDYGHPHRSVLDLLSDLGAEILRTDEEGTVTLISDGERVTRGN